MDNENIPTTPAPEAPETTPAEEPVEETPVETPTEEPAPTEEPIEEAPVEEPAEKPAEETPTEEPAPAEAPAEAAPAEAPAKSNKAAIIALCIVLGIAAIAAVVAIIIVNNNNEDARRAAEAEAANIELAKQFGEDLPIDDDDDDEQGYNYDYDYNYGTNSNTNSSSSSATLTKCSSAADCIKNLDNSEGTTVEQYNQAIGFNGTLDTNSSSYSKTYVWKFDNGDELKAKFSSYGEVDIEVDYEYSAHTSDVNLNGYDTVSDRIEDGITYAELKAALGGVDGLLSRRSSYGTKEYLWVGSTSARYLEATVNEKGLVTFVSGRK